MPSEESAFILFAPPERADGYRPEVHHEAGAMLHRPADKKWFRNFAAARIVREVLEAVDRRFSPAWT
jgi:hypothetical protein